MPLFFREKQKSSLKNVSTNSGVDSVPELVPTNEYLEGEPLSGPEPEKNRVSDLLEEVPTVPPEVIVRSRKTKPINWMLASSIFLLVAPMVVLLVGMVTDSFTRDFVNARVCSVMKDNTGALHYYSNALKVRQDLRALEARADCYEIAGDLQNERADLRQLVKSTDLNRSSKNWQAYRRYSNLANLEARLGDISSAKRLYERYATFPVGEKDGQSYYALEAAYQFLLLNDISKSKALIAQMPNKKTDMLSSTVGSSNASRQIVEALLDREDWNAALALDKIRSLGDKYVWVFRDSRFRMKSKDEVVRWTLEALIYLDSRDVGKARPLIQQAEAELNGDDNSRPILDVLKAWLLLEEGNLDDCLKLTNAMLENQKELVKSIDGMNMKAALHLIRKNVFAQQKLTKQAEYEDGLFKQSLVSGRVFTPLCFRPDR